MAVQINQLRASTDRVLVGFRPMLWIGLNTLQSKFISTSNRHLTVEWHRFTHSVAMGCMPLNSNKIQPNLVGPLEAMPTMRLLLLSTRIHHQASMAVTVIPCFHHGCPPLVRLPVPWSQQTTPMQTYPSGMQKTSHGLKFLNLSV